MLVNKYSISNHANLITLIAILAKYALLITKAKPNYITLQNDL